MLQDLRDNIYEKLKRAEQHIEQLQIEINDLVNSAPYQTISDTDPETLEDFKKMLSRIRVPPRISILAGEAIHQTRSSLDHLVSALITINGKVTSNHTQFPIYPYRPSTEDEAARYAGQISGVTPSAKALIDN